VAKISVSLPDSLVQDLQAVARGNVSAFVAEAVRNELDRLRLQGLVKELEAEVGPVDEAQVAKFSAMLAKIDVENARIAVRQAEESEDR
jgi:Arc/MetJ-type ribon-helix-helix transcriptional regulator